MSYNSDKLNSNEDFSWPPCDLKDTKNIDDKFICPKCKTLMVNVHQADDCGCRYCLDCLDQIVESGEKKCLKCNFEFASSFKIPDKYFQKKIKQINIDKCQASSDCNWKGTLLDYRDHYNSHFKVKPKLKCQYCKKTFIKESDLNLHMDITIGNCPKQPVECIFKTIGCNQFDLENCDTYEFLSFNQQTNIDVQQMEISSGDLNESNNLLRENLADHMNKFSNYHLNLIHVYYKREIENMRLKLENPKSTKSSSNNFIRREDLSATFTDSGNYSISDWYKSSSESKSFNKDNPDDSRFQFDVSKSSKFDSGFSESSSRNSNLNDSQINNFDNKLDQSYQLFSDKIDILEKNQNGLVTDLTRVTKSNDRLKQENTMLKENIKEYKAICQDLHKALALTQVSLLTLEERLINQEKTSFNGCLLWRITNVHERMQEAKSGRQTSFYSPAFYTNRDGYKMCARIYLNGDGSGRNTHLSLFFVILRGEYDALLTWPFRQKVTFTLLDQSESNEHVVDAFRPDPNSSSFKKPISEMNIASGLPVFCPLGKLMSNDREYIKDNIMFIKIKVDCEGLDGITPTTMNTASLRRAAVS